jgi:PAS domain S-box-containing protein
VPVESLLGPDLPAEAGCPQEGKSAAGRRRSSAPAEYAALILLRSARLRRGRPDPPGRRAGAESEESAAQAMHPQGTARRDVRAGQGLTVPRGKLAIALRYALAPACVGAAVLLHVSPAGSLLHPTGPYVLGVLAAAWFGGVGPGVFAAFLSALSLPQLIAITGPFSTDYPLLGGFFDLPRFVTLALTGAVVGWGTGAYRRAAAALRARERVASRARDELESAVTERTAHLAASEARYARAMQASKDGIWEWNPGTDEIFMSDRARHLWAVPDGIAVRTRAELKRLGGFHPEDVQRTEDVIAANRAPGAHGFDMEYRIIGPADEVHWVRSQARLFPGAHGRPDLVTGSLTDVTDRKRDEEALRESQQRYERVMLASNAGIWDWDVVKDEFYVSPRFLEMGGLPPDTIFSGREDFMRRGPIHPEDREQWQQAVRQLFASGGSRLSMELRAIVNGETRWRRLEGFCFRDAAGRVVRWTGSTTDITERKRAEEALRQSDERFALALAASNDGIWDWDIVTDQQFFSERAQHIFGLEPGPTVRPRPEWNALREFHPEDGPRRRAAIERHLAGETPVYEGEWRVRLAGGEYRWFQTRGQCVRDAAGRPIRMVGSVTDIDGRKRIEAALRQSEERSSLAMEATEEGHFDLNLDTGELFISERLNELYGFPPGTRFANRAEYLAQVRLHEADAEKYHAALAAAVAKDGPERYEFEFRILRPSGEVRWLRTRGKVTRDAEGRARRRTGVVADVTERKLAEEALRGSEQRYALAMEAAGDGHTDWNLETGEFYISPRLLRILGYPPGTTFADRADWVRRFPFHPEDRRRWEAAVAAHFAGREAKFRMDLRIVVNGETRWVAFTFIATRDASGKPVRWTGSIADINDAKLAEEALRESQERYALAVAGSDDGVWDCDFAARRVFVSARARELAGMPPGPEMVPMDEWFGALPIHPEDAPRRIAAMQVHLAGETPAYEGEFRLRQPDGVYRWRRLHGLCLRDAGGKPHRMAGSISDVDARRRAEEALRLSEKRYALAMEVAEEGHFDWNVQTDEIFASAQAKRVVGVPEDLECRTRAEVMARMRYHPDDWPRISAEWREALAGRATEHEFEYRILRGEEPRSIHGRWKVFRDESGAALRVIGVVADITPRKLAEEALRLSEERYALALEASEEGHFDNDLEADEIFVSARVNEIYGFPRQARILNRTEFLNQIPFHPDDRHVLAELSRTDWPDAAGDLYELECRIVPRPGETRWIHSRAKVVRDAEGRARRRIGVVADITPRKLAEEALRLSEERYALAMEASEEGHFDWNVQTDEIFASEHLKKVLDLPPDLEYRTRSAMVSRMNFCPGESERVAQMARDVLAGSALQHEFEYRLRDRAGEEPRWIHARWKIFRDADGTAQRVIGVVSDVTERKRTVDTLRVSESRFRTLVELSSNGFWVQDENLRYTSSALTSDVAGYDKHGMDGRTRWELSGDPTPLSTTWAEHQADLAARRPFRDFEYRRLRPDGKAGYYSASGAPIFDDQGRFKGYYGVASDITERKRVEEELRSRQEMLELAQKSARAIAFEWKIGESEGENRWSPDLEAMYGFAPGTYDGTFETWKKCVHPEDWPAVKDAVRHAHSTGEVASEYRVVHPDGSVHWLQARGRMFFDAVGNATRMVGFMQDITERKQAEAELRKMEQELRRAQRLEAIGTLAGGIAHDFNNILGAILGYGEMAMRDAKKGTRLRRDLDSIMAAGERGRSLVDRILAFSRSGVGERVPVHVEAVVREALDQVAASLPGDVTLMPRLRAGRAAMLGDSTQVHQVVMNLASNAVQAMPQGGVLRVTLETVRFDAARPATVGSIEPGDYIVLTLSDMGTGISDDVLERMFDPFFTTKEIGVGTGLGLSLVHGIVTNVDGAIDVATEQGKGTTFTVYLPRSGDATEGPTDEDRPLPRGEGQRVLVVDDEEPLVRLATETLEELGYVALGFTSSAAALEAIRADPQRFDAMITDERMPGMTGSALIRQVRGIRDGIPIVLMTGFVGGGAVDRARDAGADEVLKKPLSARELATSLARVLRY